MSYDLNGIKIDSFGNMKDKGNRVKNTKALILFLHEKINS